jgi:hypothetical protein
MHPEGPGDYMVKAQIELQRRLIGALSRYSENAARATFWLIVLTFVLVGLTIVLVVVALVDDGPHWLRRLPGARAERPGRFPRPGPGSGYASSPPSTSRSLAMARSVSAASPCRFPASAPRQAATIAASSIVAPSLSSR